MGRDEALARKLLAGGDQSFLRVYEWEPWAISLGRHQPEGQIVAGRCEADGIDVVRRPTGGRAILHAEELTYCVVLRSDDRDVHGVYNMIGMALQTGLRKFGVEATLERSQPRFNRLYRAPSSIPCFSSSARYELVWQGRKLIGSAQRRFGSGDDIVVLQHGSILCGPAHSRLVDYLHLEDGQSGDQIRAELQGRTVTLADMINGPADRRRLATCLREGFEETLAIEGGMEQSLSFPDGNYG